MGSFRRRLRNLAFLLGALFAAVALVGIGINLWIRIKTLGDIYDDAAEVPGRHAAIVPGASVYGDGRPTEALRDRLEAALDLYRRGVVERILVSGLSESPFYDEAGAMARWFRDEGVPEEDLLVDGRGFRTLDTMERARRVYGIDSAIVCTQGFHLPRAVFLAQRADIDGIGLVADRRQDPEGMYNWAREFLARIRAFLDSYVLGTQPESLDLDEANH